MPRVAPRHLDSRRHEVGQNKTFGDYFVRLDDAEAVEESPFREQLQALGSLGFTEILAGHHGAGTDHEELETWWLNGTAVLDGSGDLANPANGGQIRLTATVELNGEHVVSVDFDGEHEREFPVGAVNVEIWPNLDTIHSALIMKAEDPLAHLRNTAESTPRS